MRKIASVLVLVFAFTLTSQAQKKRKRMQKDPLTVEQQTTLMVKKMTLALDLSAAQQKEIQELNLENAKERQALMLERKLEKEEEGRSRPSADERFQFQNEKLDRMIAQKGKIKQILTEEQFQKWERMHHHRRNHHKEGKRGHDTRRGHGK